jgi:hypothetical protein
LSGKRIAYQQDQQQQQPVLFRDNGVTVGIKEKVLRAESYINMF